MSWELISSFIQLQGAWVFFLLGAGWTWAGIMRRRECKRQRALLRHEAAAGLNGSLANGAGKQQDWPQVSVVQPVKGVRPRSLSNWSSHLGTAYPGTLEFIFVLESVDDSAHAQLQSLAATCGLDVKVRVAGLATACSQKVFNQVAGVGFCSPASHYVLFLDDDVELHPGSVGELVAALERDPSLFMATGYPFDVPAPGSGLPTYCTLVYHVPLLLGVSATQRAAFVWGGCMLMRMEELKRDKYGILRDWLHGGYSDDLILAAKCSEHGLAVAISSAAIFPQWLEPNISWRQYWNYIRRQFYVLDTYVTPHMRTIHSCMFAFQMWASSSALLALFTAAYRVAFSLWCNCAAVRQVAGDPSQLTSVHQQQQSAAPYALLGGAAGARRALVEASECCSTDAWEWGRHWPAAVLVTMMVFAHCGLYFMTTQVLTLFAILSPKRPRLWPRQYNWFMLWAALLLENLMVPGVLLYTLVVPYVEWGGVRYYKKAGRVVKVVRPQSDS